jgi:hypothetical protein
MGQYSQISIFKDSNIAKHLSHPHEKYVVPTSKAPNTIVFVRKSHYIEWNKLENSVRNYNSNVRY